MEDPRVSVQYTLTISITLHSIGLTELIREGHVDEALQYIDEFFPHILLSHDGLENPLRFAMHCQWFVELIAGGKTAEALGFAESVLAPVSRQHPDYDAQLQVR